MPQKSLKKGKIKTEIDKEIGEVEARLAHMRSQLVGTTPEAQAELTAYLEKLNEI